VTLLVPATRLRFWLIPSSILGRPPPQLCGGRFRDPSGSGKIWGFFFFGGLCGFGVHTLPNRRRLSLWIALLQGRFFLRLRLLVFLPHPVGLPPFAEWSSLWPCLFFRRPSFSKAPPDLEFQRCSFDFPQTLMKSPPRLLDSGNRPPALIESDTPLQGASRTYFRAPFTKISLPTPLLLF